MRMTAEVQSNPEVRDWRDKSGNHHEGCSVVVVDKGESRVAGVGIQLSADRFYDPDGFAAIGKLKQDDKIEIAISGLRFSNGMYNLQGSYSKAAGK